MKTGEGHPADRDSGLEDLLIGGKKAGKSSLKSISDWEIDLENAGFSDGRGMGQWRMNTRSAKGHPGAE